MADENGKAKRVPVVSGLRFARNVEIQSGLEEKQKVVSKGFLGLVNGQPIKVVNGQPENTPEKVDETPKDKKSTPNA